MRNILFICQGEDSRAHQMAHGYPQSCQMLNLEWLVAYEHIVRSLKTHFFFWWRVDTEPQTMPP